MVWRAAIHGGFAIVSKDADFRSRSFLEGSPPRVLWIGLGNCSTHDVAELLRARHGEILSFEADAGASFLELR